MFRPAPSMTLFSSRGPNAVAPDVIKPDVTAPGLQILAGNSPFPDPDNPAGELFQAIGGTSMSSPHVAGLYALLKQAHPAWSAATAKSALMTTAYQNVRDNDRVHKADPFDFGAGHVRPGGAGARARSRSLASSTTPACSSTQRSPAAWTGRSSPRPAATSSTPRACRARRSI